jgi:hypothetical protein
MKETLDILYKNKNIHDVLTMTVDDAVLFFEEMPAIYDRVKTLQEVGLGYLELGQSATTLSGSLQTDIVMEQNFGGTFMGGLSQFRMYSEPLSAPQVQHNFRVSREKFDLFDFWCPNCLEILSECYFDFNVDLESCDFDWTITDLVSF